MRRSSAFLLRPWSAVSHGCPSAKRSLSTSSPPPPPPIISIKNATFYRDYPSTAAAQGHENPPFFSDLNFTLTYSDPSSSSSSSSPSSTQQHWAVIGSSGKARFLDVLRGNHICVPPEARVYPYLSSDAFNPTDTRLRNPARAIRYVGFNGDTKQAAAGGGIRGAYLSARYESRREETDFTVLQHLKGQTSLNALETEGSAAVRQDLLDRVIADLRLEKLVHMPIANLSNGQGRRARIAKALLDEPLVLLLDEPFMGLDPPTVRSLSPLLHQLAAKCKPRLVMSLRPQDPVPDWITHFAVLRPDHRVALAGEKSDVYDTLTIWQAVFSREVTHPEEGTTSDPSQSNLPFSPRSAEEEEEDAFFQALSPQGKEKYRAAGKLRGTDQAKDYISLLHDFGLLAKQEQAGIPPKPTEYGEPIVEMDGVQVKYGDKTVLGGWRQNVDI